MSCPKSSAMLARLSFWPGLKVAVSATFPGASKSFRFQPRRSTARRTIDDCTPDQLRMKVCASIAPAFRERGARAVDG